MIERPDIHDQPDNSKVNREDSRPDLFNKIKSIQSLPDEVVDNFLKSRGKLKRKIFSPEFHFNEK
jgi:hypothetical protein